MLLTAALHVVAHAQVGISSVCPVCGDGPSASGAGSDLTWLVVAGLAAAFVARAVMRKRAASRGKALPSPQDAARGRGT